MSSGADCLGDTFRQAPTPCSPDESCSSRELLSRLAAWAGRLPGVEHVFVDVNETDEDSRSQEVSFNFQNAELREWLQKNPHDLAALVRGKPVILSPDVFAGSEQRQPCGPTFLLVPLVSNSVLQAVLRLEVRDPARTPSPQMLDSLSRLCGDIAPIVSWMWRSGEPRTGALPTLGGAGNPERTDTQSAKKPCQTERSGPTSVEALADMVHDLRDPLVAVRGYAKMLLEEKSGRINETQREYLATILKNAQRMASLLNGLSGLVANWQIRLEPLDIRELPKPSVLSSPAQADAPDRGTVSFEATGGRG